VGVVEYLFLPPGPPGSAFQQWGSFLFGAFVVQALAVSLLSGVMRTLNGGHHLKNDVARLVLLWGGGFALLGILLLGLRFLAPETPVVSMRALLLALLLAEVAGTGYLLWWLRRRYPHRLALYQLEEKKRAYLPRAAGGKVEAARRKPAVRRRR
jgi:hypothetical protein